MSRATSSGAGYALSQLVRTVMAKQRTLNVYPRGDARTTLSCADWNERDAQLDRVGDVLNACSRVAPLLGPESVESLYVCLERFEEGAYELFPSSEALCLNFWLCSKITGMLVFFESDRTWSLHT